MGYRLALIEVLYSHLRVMIVLLSGTPVNVASGISTSPCGNWAAVLNTRVFIAHLEVVRPDDPS